MLKAGKSIKIKSQIYSSDNGILVSPSISIHELQLRADAPIPKIILGFLEAKGAIVQQIEEDGDKLIRISGNFRITAKEVTLFFQSHPALKASNTSVEAQESTSAINFQRQVINKRQNILQLNKTSISIGYDFYSCGPTQASEEGQSAGSMQLNNTRKLLASLNPASISAGTQIVLDCGGVTKLGAGTTSCSGEDTIITAGKQFIAGGKPLINTQDVDVTENTSVGMLTQMLSTSNINIQAHESNSLINCLIRAKENILLNSNPENGVITTSLTLNTAWTNAPETPSLTLGYIAQRNVAPETSSSSSSSSSCSSQPAAQLKEEEENAIIKNSLNQVIAGWKTNKKDSKFWLCLSAENISAKNLQENKKNIEENLLKIGLSFLSQKVIASEDWCILIERSDAIDVFLKKKVNRLNSL